MEERLKKIEDFLFTPNSDFQTKAFESVLNELEGSKGLGIGKRLSQDNAARLEITSTTKGFRPPRLTTTQRDAIINPGSGLLIHNTTTNKLNIYTTTWETVTSA